MYCLVHILFPTFFAIRVGGVPSGFKILGGRDATENEYPFIVRLERQILYAFAGIIKVEENIHICTGTVLTPRWTLTAGHCIDSAGPKKEISVHVRIQTVIRYGVLNGSIAEVTSTVRHNSFKDKSLQMQNDIGLVRTEMIKIRKYARLSALNLNILGGQEIILTGHLNLHYISKRNPIHTTVSKLRPLQLLNVYVVRYDYLNESTLPVECVARHCVPSATSICPQDSGGPMLHTTGVIGINTISLEKIKLCAAVSQNRVIGMDIITPIYPFHNWITNNIKRDELVFDVIS